MVIDICIGVRKVSSTRTVSPNSRDSRSELRAQGPVSKDPVKNSTTERTRTSRSLTLKNSIRRPVPYERTYSTLPDMMCPTVRQSNRRSEPKEQNRFTCPLGINLGCLMMGQWRTPLVSETLFLSIEIGNRDSVICHVFLSGVKRFAWYSEQEDLPSRFTKWTRSDENVDGESI